MSTLQELATQHNWNLPVVCPVCGSTLDLSPNHMHLTCTNEFCSSKASGMIAKWCSINGIKELGLTTIEKIQEINGGKLCSVMAIDKAGKVGGKSALCHEFNAVNPPKYKEMFNNGEDFVDAEAYKQTWLDFTMGADGVQKAKPEMIELFVEKSGDTIDWLFDRGWRFGTLDVSPMAGGIVSYNSVLASNIDTGTYEDRRAGVNKYYKSFLSFCEAEGGKYMLETEGYEILTDGDRVTGIKARNNVTGQEYIIHCKALIMGCGGWIRNGQAPERHSVPVWTPVQ